MMKWYGRKYFILTLTLTAYLLLVPLFSVVTTTTIIEELVFFILLLTTLYSVAHNRKLLILGTILTAITLWATLVTDNPQHPKFTIGLLCALTLILAVIAIIIRDVLMSKDIVIDTIFGAISAYLLIGVAWALVYLFVEIYIPQSFVITTEPLTQAIEPTDQGSFNLYNYFSFVTMTTLGYGDIIPAHPVSRALATYQAIFGQMYIAILVARLVSLHLTKQ